MFRLLTLVALLTLLDIYVYQSLQLLSNSIWGLVIFFGFSLLVNLLCLYIFLFNREAFPISISNLIIGLFFMFILSKLVIVVFLFIEDIIRVLRYMSIIIFGNNQFSHFPSRNTLFSQITLGIAAVPFFSLLYGMLYGKYNYKVLKQTLYFNDLPKAFDGYRITHISDIHCGSFDNKKKVAYGIKLINQQKSDIIFFTGDLVNSKATEVLPWINTLSTLKAKDGVFSILGNHDYGDYVQWGSIEEKEVNFEQLKNIQKEMGYQLLLNQSHFITRGNQRIAIIGVENWGKGFIKKGDLSKATLNIRSDDFNIVLSHDPTHWEEEIVNFPKHLHLTLSGHTHGMQFGIEILGWIKWSPVKYRYKKWAGIYESAETPQNAEATKTTKSTETVVKYININRGFGFLGYPGRFGIWPEITVLELRRKNDY